MFRILAIVIGVSLIASNLRADEIPSPAPHWISHPAEKVDQPHSFRLTKKVSVPTAPHSATLRFAADFCFATIDINGRRVADVEPYGPTIDLDVLSVLAAGANQMTITVEPVEGPTAVALSLSVGAVDGAQTNVITDTTWTADAPNGTAPAASRGAVAPELWGIGRRPPTIDAFDNYEQWRQASKGTTGKPASFWIAPGFELTVVRDAQEGEGSWVSMCFDPKGRLIVAREDKGLLRMTLSSARDAIDSVETINDQLLECRGLLYAHDSLFANANNSKGLYRLQNAKDQDGLEEVTLLREFPGGVGHGRNDLALGPNRKISFITGDDISIPTTEVSDLTSPTRDARRGQPKGEGWFGQIDEDGKNCEVLCAGMRNPFGVAFDAAGDAFTYDADAEFDMGTPWYRPTRILPLVSGADFGWRAVTGQWPPYFPDRPDVAPPVLDIGKGSPTAVLFGTETNFPEDYQQALFILDWAYGRVLAVHMKPRGMGYRAAAETFLKGRPLNVTDVAAGPDGDLYFISGGRKTQSALYRVHYNGAESTSSAPSEHEIACAEQARFVRATTSGLDPWPAAGSDDPHVRAQLRGTLDRLPIAELREASFSKQSPIAKLEGLTALARRGEHGDIPRILDGVLELNPAELHVFQVRMTLNIISLCRAIAPDEVTSRRDRIIERFAPVFDSATSGGEFSRVVAERHRMVWELAELLVSLKSPGSIERTLSTLLSSDLQEDQLAGLFILRNVESSWTLDQRRVWLKTLSGAPNFVSGEGMPQFINHLRREFTASLSEAEKRELADDLKPRIGETDTLPAPRTVVKHWSGEDFAGLLDSPASDGAAKRGEAVFRDALCARCHRFGSKGPSIGPDLTYVAGRFSRRDLLESMLKPSKVVAENYRGAVIATTDGETFTGRVMGGGDYRSQLIRLATKPLDFSAIVEIDKRKIESIQESKTSTMPESLLDGFTQAEILDLIAYLTSH